MTFATKLATASAVALMVGASGASAAFLQLEQLTASWFETSGGTNVQTSGNGTANPFLAWGDPVVGPNTTDHGGIIGEGSGYELEIPNDPVPDPAVEPGSGSFDFGTFTHFNNPIASGTSIDSTKLELLADVTLADDILGTNKQTIVDNALFTFEFIHNETPNAGPCEVGDPPCADIVEVTLLNDSSSVEVDGVLYTLSFLGFRQNGILNDVFISPEGGFSPGIIEAQFTAVDLEAVPLPAAGWLLLGGLGGLAALRRKKKAA